MAAGWAGAIDWSGSTAVKAEADASGFYVCALVAFESPEELSAGLWQIRRRYGMAPDAEFHAHDLPEEIQYAAIQEVLSHQPYLAVIRYDKQEMQQRQMLPKPADFPAVAALALLKECLPRVEIASIVFDEDIQGNQKQKAFLTEVRRLARFHVYPTRLRTRFVRSRSNDLAQAADLFANAFYRDTQNRIRISDYQQCIRNLRQPGRMVFRELP